MLDRKDFLKDIKSIAQLIQLAYSTSLTYRIIVSNFTFAPVLSRHKGKLNVPKFAPVPPRALFHGLLTPTALHKGLHSRRHEPHNVRETTCKFANGFAVEVVVVIVTDDDRVDVWQVIYAARGISVTSNAKLEYNFGTTLVTKNGIC